MGSRSTILETKCKPSQRLNSPVQYFKVLAMATSSSAEPEEQRRAWIHFSRNWAPFSIGKDWVGRRYLGGGSYGMAGLFEYVGNDDNVNPRQIVIKQEKPPGGNLKQESHVLSRLMKYKSDHIIKIYRAYHLTFARQVSPSVQCQWLGC